MALSKFLQNVPKKFEILQAPSYKMQKKKKKSAPHYHGN